MGKEFELNKVAIVMGQVLLGLKELEPKLKTSFDVYEEKESLLVLAYMCRVGILDRIMNTTYLQNPDLPIVIPLDIIRVRKETMSTGVEITIGKIQELASMDQEVGKMVDSVLEKGEVFYALENNLPDSVKNMLCIETPFETIGSHSDCGKKDGFCNEEGLNGHRYVDLGLPSGTLWATCNIGAKTPEQYGDYFAWNSDDIASAVWGDRWRTPTKDEWNELIYNTKKEWTIQNDVPGRLFTANNGNSIFLPAAGGRWGDDVGYAGSWGYYWSNSLYDDNPHGAWACIFSSMFYSMDGSSRSLGHSIRAVCSAFQRFSVLECK